MKNLIILFLLFSAFTALGQSQVNVSGHGDGEALQGTPSPMQPVFFTIMHGNDSLNLDL